MHRFFIPPEWIRDDQIVFKDETARQMRHVLRIRNGETVIVLDNLGNEFEVEITQPGEPMSGRIVSKSKNKAEPPINLTLLVALAQREKMEWILQKGTEVGVSRFISVVTERSLVQDVNAIKGKMDRWRTILREAAEQSGRGIIPELSDAISFKNSLGLIAEFDLGLVAWEQEQEISLNSVFASKQSKKVGLMIGPEGGFTTQEYKEAIKNGWKSISLGKRILRMETAAVVASALIIAHYEQKD
jgi:16S rRNA (uracil1498-N3)-methyltransferase